MDPNRLTHAVSASYKSIYGTIVSNMRYEEDSWRYLVTVPANTTATIRLPVEDIDTLVINGCPYPSEVPGLKLKVFDKGRKLVIFEAAASTYSFISRFS